MTGARRTSGRSSRSSMRVQNFCRAVGVSSPWLAAQVHASRVFASQNSTGVPIDIQEICRQRGIQVEITQLRECNARILPVPGGYVAQLDNEQSRGRRRFSLCHEFAHTLFDIASAEGPHFRSLPTSADALEESLCDRFASELLMPIGLFTEICAAQEPTWSGLCTVAATFDVSIEAAVNRIQDLNIWQCFFVECACVRGTETGVSLEMKWFQGSRSLIRNPIGSVFLINEILDFLNRRAKDSFAALWPCTFCTESGMQFSVGGHMMTKTGKPLARFLIVKARDQASPALPLLRSVSQTDLGYEPSGTSFAI